MSDPKIRTRDTTPAYRTGWDQVWGKRKRAEKRAKGKDGERFCWECGMKHFLEDACAG